MNRTLMIKNSKNSQCQLSVLANPNNAQLALRRLTMKSLGITFALCGHLSLLLLLLSIQNTTAASRAGVGMEKLVSISDFQASAKAKLFSNRVWEHIEGGVDEEFTVDENRKAYRRYVIRPRFLRNITERSLVTTILGKPIAFPLGIAPTGEQKMAHPDGEIATARGAGIAGAIYVLSIASTYSIEQVAAAAAQTKTRIWFQLEMLTNHELNLQLLQRAENAGYEAVVLTIDAQFHGKNRPRLRDPIQFSDLRLANFPPTKDTNSDPMEHDTSVTWDVIGWIRENTKMKLVVKGIMTGEDASIAAKRGVDAIIVSNHGGRIIDSVLPTIEVLSEVIEAVPSGFEVYLDGGIMLGSDIFKALALGAKMVFVGRPALWGLAVGGEDGVVKVLEIYKSELDSIMGISGVSRVGDINRRSVQRIGPSYESKYFTTKSSSSSTGKLHIIFQYPLVLFLSTVY